MLTTVLIYVYLVLFRNNQGYNNFLVDCTIYIHKQSETHPPKHYKHYKFLNVMEHYLVHRRFLEHRDIS